MDWKYLEPKIGTTDISDFGRQNARFLLATMINEGLSPKVSRDRIAFIRQLLIFASQELEMRVKSLNWQLRYPASPPKKIKNFTEAEMLRIVKATISEIESGNQSNLPALIALLTGMRIGEVLGLKWKDIDFDRKIVNVERNVTISYDPELKTQRYLLGAPKTAKGFRTIPLLPTLKNALKIISGKMPSDELFVVGNSNKPKSHSYVRDCFDRLLKRNNLPDINFHGLRHTFATLLVESGGDIKTISDILGHANVATTLNLYVHPSLDAKIKVVNKAFRKLRGIEKDEVILYDQN